jgi:enolase
VGREILDSRGNPTLEAEVWLDGGTFTIFVIYDSFCSANEKQNVSKNEKAPTKR